MNNEFFNTMWIGRCLTSLERLSLLSFARQCGNVRVYVYDDVDSIPPDVEVIDGETVLPRELINTLDGAGLPLASRIAEFADLFRYTLLRKEGGWWFDADVVCIRPFDFTGLYCFGRQSSRTINNAVIRLPAGSEIAYALEAEAWRRAQGSHSWGDIGPGLLTRLVREFGLEDYARNPEDFYPVHYTEADKLLSDDPSEATWDRVARSYSVHFYNDRMGRLAIDKDRTFPITSVYERLKQKYQSELRAD